MRIAITGTDTDVGKTVFAAALVGALGASYWKPVQAGLDDGTDAQRVAELSGAMPERILPEAYRLNEPLSPHLAAEHMDLTIEAGRLALPDVAGPLVIEGAGGLLVPLSRSLLVADMFALWDVPVVLVARTALGTINHSMLSIEALKARGIAIMGVAFSGDANEESEATIAELGKVKRLGRLPRVEPLEQDALAQAFAAHFRLADFEA
jgi:dethiobiotin synthetase